MQHKTIGIGLLGGWQEHIYRFAHLMVTEGFSSDSMKHWDVRPYEGCSIVGVWDDDPERGRRLADTFAAPFTADLDEFLADPAIDAVIVCSPTVLHAEHITRAAQAGKHIFVEKAPFTTVAGAEAAREAIRASGVHFMVSSPMDKPRVRFAKRFVDEGLLGEINEIRFRLTNEGALGREDAVGIYNRQENGGGAMMDFGQHGVHILHWFLGTPTRVSARFGKVTDFAKRFDIEDNAVAVFEYDSGAIGVVEAGWASPYHECFLDVLGTKGRLHVVGDDVTVAANGDRRIFDEVVYELGGKNPVRVDESELPEPILFPLRDWVETIRNDTPDERFTIDDAVEWTRMLEAAYRAAEVAEPVR